MSVETFREKTSMQSIHSGWKILLAGLPLVLVGCWANGEQSGSTSIMVEEPRSGESGRDEDREPSGERQKTAPTKTEVATLGAGCFWCVEAVFEQLDGVVDVTSGYMGGATQDPTYEQVCSGTTGHAEVTQVTFDPSRMSFEKLLDHFWKLHDPTTRNRQGADVGTQYRSVIYYHSDAQRQTAEASKKALDKSGLYSCLLYTSPSPRD